MIQFFILVFSLFSSFGMESNYPAQPQYYGAPYQPAGPPVVLTMSPPSYCIGPDGKVWYQTNDGNYSTWVQPVDPYYMYGYSQLPLHNLPSNHVQNSIPPHTNDADNDDKPAQAARNSDGYNNVPKTSRDVSLDQTQSSVAAKAAEIESKKECTHTHGHVDQEQNDVQTRRTLTKEFKEFQEQIAPKIEKFVAKNSQPELSVEEPQRKIEQKPKEQKKKKKKPKGKTTVPKPVAAHKAKLDEKDFDSNVYLQDWQEVRKEWRKAAGNLERCLEERVPSTMLERAVGLKNGNQKYQAFLLCKQLADFKTQLYEEDERACARACTEVALYYGQGIKSKRKSFVGKDSQKMQDFLQRAQERGDSDAPLAALKFYFEQERYDDLERVCASLLADTIDDPLVGNCIEWVRGAIFFTREKDPEYADTLHHYLGVHDRLGFNADLGSFYQWMPKKMLSWFDNKVEYIYHKLRADREMKKEMLSETEISWAYLLARILFEHNKKADNKYKWRFAIDGVTRDVWPEDIIYGASKYHDYRAQLYSALNSTTHLNLVDRQTYFDFAIGHKEKFGPGLLLHTAEGVMQLALAGGLRANVTLFQIYRGKGEIDKWLNYVNQESKDIPLVVDENETDCVHLLRKTDTYDLFVRLAQQYPQVQKMLSVVRAGHALSYRLPFEGLVILNEEIIKLEELHADHPDMAQALASVYTARGKVLKRLYEEALKENQGYASRIEENMLASFQKGLKLGDEQARMQLGIFYLELLDSSESNKDIYDKAYGYFTTLADAGNEYSIEALIRLGELVFYKHQNERALGYLDKADVLMRKRCDFKIKNCDLASELRKKINQSQKVSKHKSCTKITYSKMLDKSKVALDLFERAKACLDNQPDKSIQLLIEAFEAYNFYGILHYATNYVQRDEFFLVIAKLGLLKDDFSKKTNTLFQKICTYGLAIEKSYPDTTSREVMGLWVVSYRALTEFDSVVWSDIDQRYQKMLYIMSSLSQMVLQYDGQSLAIDLNSSRINYTTKSIVTQEGQVFDIRKLLINAHRYYTQQYLKVTGVRLPTFC